MSSKAHQFRREARRELVAPPQVCGHRRLNSTRTSHSQLAVRRRGEEGCTEIGPKADQSRWQGK